MKESRAASHRKEAGRVLRRAKKKRKIILEKRVHTFLSPPDDPWSSKRAVIRLRAQREDDRQPPRSSGDAIIEQAGHKPLTAQMALR